MTNKVGVSEICCSHLSTLNNRDLFSFVGLPVVLVAVTYILDIQVAKDALGLLVSFGSIFTALLLSLLVLIFDQESKLDDKKSYFDSQNEEFPFYRIRKELLKQLYSNISFSILCSLMLVIVCVLNAQLITYEASIRSALNIFISNNMLNPLIVFLLTLTILNILMILKRIHSLLTIKPEDKEQSENTDVEDIDEEREL